MPDGRYGFGPIQSADAFDANRCKTALPQGDWNSLVDLSTQRY